ncbi:restriction endonuclease subunit S [Pontibacter sp. H249]|uniref:restriction endonuclease subunit S n=1 Tax=Pontibacter sp. H249 TaxID=3133420 RepID=UPI0030C3340F
MLLLEQFENLTLHPKNAASLKKLVLQLAVQGKLTENWRRQNPDVEPAANLLKRIEAEKAQLVKEKMIKKEKPLEPVSEDEVPHALPENWAWLRLGELTYNFGQKIPDAIFSYIDVASVDNKRGVIGDLQTILPNEAPSRARKIVQEGCVIYSTVRPYLLNIALVEKNYEPGAIASTAFAILNPLPSLDKKFLYYYLRSAPFIEYVKSQMIGVAYPAINDAKLLSGAVPLPPLAEQEVIVARVEELMQKIEELEKQTAERIWLKQHLGAAALQQLTAATDEELEQNLLFLKQHFQTIFDEAANVKKLRETILQLAVQGKLTATWRTQNPTIEPASELLKRIQAKKAQLVKEKMIKKEKPLELISEDEVPYSLPEGWVWCRLSNIILDTDAGKSPQCDNRSAAPDEFGFIKTTAIQSLQFLPNENKAILKADHANLKYEIKPGDILITRAGPRNRVGVVCAVTSTRDKLLLSDKTVRISLIAENQVNARFLAVTLSTGASGDFLESKKSGMADSQVNITQDNIKLTPVALPPLAEQEAIVAKVDQLMLLCDELEQQIHQSKQEAEALMHAVVQEALQVQEEVEL